MLDKNGKEIKMPDLKDHLNYKHYCYLRALAKKYGVPTQHMLAVLIEVVMSHGAATLPQASGLWSIWCLSVAKEQKVQLIKTIREKTRAGLLEAKHASEGIIPIASGVDEATATCVAKSLTTAGAEIELLPELSSPSLPYTAVYANE